MDFRITDAWTDPPGKTEQWHTEALVRLPGSLWCYRPWPESPPVSPAPSLASGYVTFGSANNPAKLNPGVVEAWGRILARVPQSRILLHAPDDADLRRRLVTILSGRGVEIDRIAFFARLPVAEYLGRYAQMDIALDPFPCGGGTTTFDALWMGVPVVSLAGDRPFSRGGASVLGNLGLADCLAFSRDEYVERAVALAADVPALASRRPVLRASLEGSVLMDAQSFTRAMESAFLGMCRARGLALPEGT